MIKRTTLADLEKDGTAQHLTPAAIALLKRAEEEGYDPGQPTRMFYASAVRHAKLLALIGLVVGIIVQVLQATSVRILPPHVSAFPLWLVPLVFASISGTFGLIYFGWRIVVRGFIPGIDDDRPRPAARSVG